MKRLAYSLIAVCLTGCAVHGEALAARGVAPTAIFLLEPTDIPNTYDYAALDYQTLPSPGRWVNFYRNGASLGRARLVSIAEPSGIDGIEASFSPSITITDRTMITERDINPGARYILRAATREERAELISLDAPSNQDALLPMPGDYSQRLEVLTIVSDTSGQRGDVAVHTSESRSFDPHGEPFLKSYLGVFVRSPSGRWTVEHTEAQSGCDGCEAQPSTWSLVGFGDVRGTGELMLLFTNLGYEGCGLSGYELSRSGKGAWLVPGDENE